MERFDNKSGVSDSLRFRAEKVIGVKRDASGDDAASVLHELRVHQIELEIQNEELRLTQVALQESLARYVELYDSSPAGYVSLNEEGVIVEANLTLVTMLGATRNKLIAAKFNRFIFAEDQDIFYHHWRGLLQQEQVSELRLVRGDSQRLWVRLESKLSKNVDGTRTCRAIVSDISRIKQAESESQEQVAKASALSQQSDELRIEKQHAEQIAEAKTQFLSAMSHEIRTPMNGIIGLLGLLSETPLSSEQTGYMEMVREAADGLLSIINDILDFSKMEAGRMGLEAVPFDLHDTMQSVVDLLGPRAKEKGIDLLLWYDPRMPRSYVGDALRIRQILMNLASNAIKFTHRGLVLLEASTTPQLPSGVRFVRLSVHDTGIGIAADRLNLLFERFQQLGASTSRKFGGTGLGLAIVKELVTLMGGAVSVASVPGEGSTFSLEIPLPIPFDKADPGAIGTLRGVRILIVDEERLTRSIISEFCRCWGMHVEEAGSVDQALQMVNSSLAVGHAFQLVCLNRRVAGEDEAAIARRLRYASGGKKIGIILIATSLAEDEKTQPTDYDAFLRKPIQESVLSETLRSVVGGLPREASTAAVPPSRSKPASIVENKKALLAEDNIVNQRVAMALLSKLGCHVDIAINGEEACRMAEENQYDIIFMDCHMPVMDGYEAVVEIRNREGNGRRTPVVAITADVMMENRAYCLSKGMDDYVTKPVSKESLLAILDRWLRPNTDSGK